LEDTAGGVISDCGSEEKTGTSQKKSSEENPKTIPHP
jgi:hypothetical protein